MTYLRVHPRYTERPTRKMPREELTRLLEASREMSSSEGCPVLMDKAGKHSVAGA